MRLRSLVFLAATALSAQTWEKLPDGSSGQVMDVPVGGNVSLAAYVRKPDGPGPFPLVVIIHGGGPSKETTYELGRRMKEPTANLVAAGWAIVCLDFRPNPRTTLDPSDLDDAMAAIAKVRTLPYIDGKRLAL